MLEFTEFKEQFISDCRKGLAAFAGTCGGGLIEIKEQDITKAQAGRLSGLIFSRVDSLCAPTYYVEDFYDLYKDGHSLKELSFELVQNAYYFVNNAPDFDGDAMSIVEDPARLRVRMISTSMNRELLETTPHIDLDCGLALIAEVRSDEYRAVITEGLLEGSGLDKEELFDRALSNTAESDPAVLQDLSELIETGDDMCENLLERAPGSTLPLPDTLYVLTNEKKYWGASALVYPGMIKRLSILMGGDFYVLPSSVHEVLLLPVQAGDPVKLQETIHAGNRTVTESRDFLADDLFVVEQCRLRKFCFSDMN